MGMIKFMCITGIGVHARVILYVCTWSRYNLLSFTVETACDSPVKSIAVESGWCGNGWYRCCFRMVLSPSLSLNSHHDVCNR